MMTSNIMPVTANNDAELVNGTLSGNRDAFSQIVSRYQSLICSLAYSATGSLGQSEDLAQETFITAWKHLGHLRERDKLRAWLCGIARNRINGFLRREGREPSHQAEPLDELPESHSPEPLPIEHTISNEEQAILWRSLERIPEIYREPLVLFYREHQSIGSVAQHLDLTEDAVKQRLSRGRKMLQEQVLAFIEGALERTNPGKAFTLGVITALPLLATAAKASTVTASAAKGGAMAKATGLGAFLQAIAALSPFLLMGGFFGFKMGGDARQSSRQRGSVVTFWRIVVGSLAAFVVVPLLLLSVLNSQPAAFSDDLRQRVLDGITFWLGLMYAVVPAALVLWAWQRRRKLQSQSVCEPKRSVAPGKKMPVLLWVIIAMIGTACLLGFALSDTNWKVHHLTTAEVQKLVANSKNNDIRISISQYQSGYSWFFIKLSENGKQSTFSAPVDDATLELLKERGISCPTYVAGRDFELLGWPGRLLPVFCIFILAIGGVVLLRKPGRTDPPETNLLQTRKLEQLDRLVNKAFGTGVALMLLAAVILLFFLTSWRDRSIPSTETRDIILSAKIDHYQLFQFNGGKRELWIFIKDDRRHLPYAFYPNYYVAPADEPTLALLREKGVDCPITIQGRDFGFRDPNRWVSLLCISFLMAGAISILKWAWKRQPPTSAEAPA